MARRKAHPSRGLLVAWFVFIIIGASTRHWQEILTGVAGIIAMFFVWVAFRYVVRCDVKTKTKPGYCRHQIKGVLFGCNDHYWEKVLAWTRYAGMGYIASMLHINLPILRWQDRAASYAPSTGRQPVASVAFASLGNPGARQEQPQPQQAASPSPRMQAISIYVGLISGLVTIIGFGLSIAQIAK